MQHLKMRKIIFFNFSFFCIISFLSSASVGHRILDQKTAKQSSSIDDIEIKKESSFLDSLPENNSTTNITESDNLFWTVPYTNDTSEGNLQFQLVSQETGFDVEMEVLKDEKKEEGKVQDNIFMETKSTEATGIHETTLKVLKYDSFSNTTAFLNSNIDEIYLQRKNCYLEIIVQETPNQKMQIKFDELKNNTSGKCFIILNAPKNTLLAILLSNISLYQNGSDREVLKVITRNQGFTFVLKEYYSWSIYYPLLLTESHKVYLILHYKVTTVRTNKNDSFFDLEVFTYHKNKIYIQRKDEYSSTKSQNMSLLSPSFFSPYYL